MLKPKPHMVITFAAGVITFAISIVILMLSFFTEVGRVPASVLLVIGSLTVTFSLLAGEDDAMDR